MGGRTHAMIRPQYSFAVVTAQRSRHSACSAYLVRCPSILQLSGALAAVTTIDDVLSYATLLLHVALCLCQR